MPTSDDERGGPPAPVAAYAGRTEVKRPTPTQPSVVEWLAQIDAADEDAPFAAVKLARLCSQREGADAAEVEWSYRTAVDSGDAEWAPIAAQELGQFRYQRGDSEGARIALQIAIDSGHPTAAPAAVQLLSNIVPPYREVGGEAVYLLPADWPSGRVDTTALFDGYYPLGWGGRDAVIRSWAGEGTPTRTESRGWQPHGGDPVLNSPLREASGGVVYFSAHAGTQNLQAMFELLDIRRAERDYAVIFGQLQRSNGDGIRHFSARAQPPVA